MKRGEKKRKRGRSEMKSMRQRKRKEEKTGRNRPFLHFPRRGEKNEGTRRAVTNERKEEKGNGG